MSGYKNIALTDILPPKIDARTVADENKFSELVESIKQHGIIEPVVLQDLGDGKYEIICGTRRVMAANAISMGKIPAVVKSLKDEDLIGVRLDENSIREDLSPIDEARYIERVMKEYGFNQRQVAQYFHKTEAHIVQMLNLLRRDPVITTMVEQEDISASVARELLRIPQEEKRREYAGYAKRSGANVRTVKSWVERSLYDMNRAAGQFTQPEQHEPQPMPDTFIATHPCNCCGRVGPLDAMIIIRTCPDCGQAIENAIHQGVFRDEQQPGTPNIGEQGADDGGTNDSSSSSHGADSDTREG